MNVLAPSNGAAGCCFRMTLSNDAVGCCSSADECRCRFCFVTFPRFWDADIALPPIAAGAAHDRRRLKRVTPISATQCAVSEAMVAACLFVAVRLQHPTFEVRRGCSSASLIPQQVCV